MDFHGEVDTLLEAAGACTVIRVLERIVELTAFVREVWAMRDSIAMALKRNATGIVTSVLTL